VRRAFLPQDSSWEADFRANGFGTFVDQYTGQQVLMTHGREDGVLGCLKGSLASALPKPDLVVCCFPTRVAARYSHLSIWGDWDTPTCWIHNAVGILVYSQEEWEGRVN